VIGACWNECRVWDGRVFDGALADNLCSFWLSADKTSPVRLRTLTVFFADPKPSRRRKADLDCCRNQWRHLPDATSPRQRISPRKRKHRKAFNACMMHLENRFIIHTHKWCSSCYIPLKTLIWKPSEVSQYIYYCWAKLSRIQITLRRVSTLGSPAVSCLRTNLLSLGVGSTWNTFESALGNISGARITSTRAQFWFNTGAQTGGTQKPGTGLTLELKGGNKGPTVVNKGVQKSTPGKPRFWESRGGGLLRQHPIHIQTTNTPMGQNILETDFFGGPQSLVPRAPTPKHR